MLCNPGLLSRHQRISVSFCSAGVSWTLHFTETSSTPLLPQCKFFLRGILLFVNVVGFLFLRKLQEWHFQYECRGYLENAGTRSWIYKEMNRRRHRRCKFSFHQCLQRSPGPANARHMMGLLPLQ